MFFLLLFLLTANAVIVTFDVHSLAKEHQPMAVDVMMHTFAITERNLKTVSTVLSSLNNAEYFYCSEYETAERIAELLRYAHIRDLHGTVYGLCKLAWESTLAEKITHLDVSYQVNIHKPLQNPEILEAFTDDEVQSFLLTTMKNQIMKMQDLTNMTILLKNSIKTADPFVSFKKFLPILTPEILAVFLDPTQPYSDTFSALIIKYMNEPVNINEWTLRNLLVLQACREISSNLEDLPLAVDAKERLAESLDLDPSDEKGNAWLFLWKLLGITNRTDISYWSCLASFALYVEAFDRSRETLIAFESILSKGHAYLPPLYVQRIVARCERHPGLHWKSLVRGFNPIYLPSHMRSLGDKRTLWLDMRVMQMVRARAKVAMTEDECSVYLLKKLSKKYLPTNINCRTQEGTVSNIGDWVINRVAHLVEEGFLYDPISVTTMSMVVASWAYLILDDNKLVFGNLFKNVSSWHDFRVKMQNWPGGGNTKIASEVMAIIRSIGLGPLFKLQEMRTLVEHYDRDEI
ncbi:hypothetical protein PSACC_03041 [Paramicrosporidium saccamoebae]|uniref:Uncharacterized protein n=1 Tax=Paramicrosporidium saccamoebae TaxID=1246581 RepID=A0A2H9THB4_9FUNG|nr:hypothetical protein PSACC_03041 [Paramicrosporidium saccamoebae]